MELGCVHTDGTTGGSAPCPCDLEAHLLGLLRCAVPVLERLAGGGHDGTVAGTASWDGASLEELQPRLSELARELRAAGEGAWRAAHQGHIAVYSLRHASAPSLELAAEAIRSLVASCLELPLESSDARYVQLVAHGSAPGTARTVARAALR